MFPIGVHIHCPHIVLSSVTHIYLCSLILTCCNQLTIDDTFS